VQRKPIKQRQSAMMGIAEFIIGRAFARPVGSTHPAISALALPVADAAGSAGPDLDPRIERLRVQRITVAMRQSGARGAARWLRAHMRNMIAWILDGRRVARWPARPRCRDRLGFHRNRANSAGGPSRFGDSTAFERSS